MAGDWIKMRASLCTHPKVMMIADIVAESTEIGRRLSTGCNGALSGIVTSDVTRDVTLASLLRVWCATNEHTTDGVWRNSTLRTIDQAAGIPGFGAAMAAAGWAVYDEEARTVTLPNFLENNAPAKHGARSTSAERQARYRDRLREKSTCDSDVTRDVTRDVTSNAREEKRREEEKPMRKAAIAPPGFDEFWSVYPKRRNRGDAEKAWAKLKPDASLQAKILQAVEVARARDDWRKDGGQFVPYPASWLNAKGWEDDVAGDAPDQPSDPNAWRRNPLFADVVAQ